MWFRRLPCRTSVPATAPLGEWFREVLETASQHACAAGGEYVGTEHLLSAVLVDDAGPAAALCRRLGVEPAAVRAEMLLHIPPSCTASTAYPAPLVLTPRAQSAVRLGRDEATRVGRETGPGHLLFGLLMEDHGVAAQILLNLGAIPDAARQVLESEA